LSVLAAIVFGATACGDLAPFEAVGEDGAGDREDPGSTGGGPSFEGSTAEQGEEPSPPVGFTEESWEQYLMDLANEGTTVELGGLDVIAAAIDRPLVWDGPVPEVEIVALSRQELDELGVKPGDRAPGSTAIVTRVYALATDEAEGGQGSGDPDSPSKGFPDTPEANPGDNFWDGQVGSSLAFGRDSGIAMLGCFDAGWFPSPVIMDRRGEACFYGYYTANEECVEVLYPRFSCPFFSVRTTIYAKLVYLDADSGTFLWLVYEPDVWVSVGEDGWDDITLRADKYAALFPMQLWVVAVVHNDKVIVAPGVPSMPFELGAPPDELDLTDPIWTYKQSLVFGSDHPVILRAIEDYAQTASVKYPVFPMPELWFGFQVPLNWCSEFASWAYRQGGADVGYDGFADLPAAEAGHEDFGIGDFLAWAGDVGREVKAFGRDEEGNPGLQNGPTAAEWAELADWVQEGDYLARREEYDGDDVTPVRAHSMVIVGWLADDGSSVGPESFDANRPCNRLLMVDGNTGGIGEEAGGLGSIVNASRRVVCRQALDPEGYSIDPKCDIDGDGTYDEGWERCDVRLWDTLANGTTKSSFFIDMSME
jgi:hypothetical protein